MNTNYINILLKECFKRGFFKSNLAQMTGLGRSIIKQTYYNERKNVDCDFILRKKGHFQEMLIT